MNRRDRQRNSQVVHPRAATTRQSERLWQLNGKISRCTADSVSRITEDLTHGPLQ